MKNLVHWLLGFLSLGVTMSVFYYARPDGVRENKNEAKVELRTFSLIFTKSLKKIENVKISKT